jgi:hypothetical protein
MDTMIWMLLMLLVAAYCIVQIVRDYRRGDHVMAVAGLACVLLLLLTPIKTHAVKLDLPINEAR